MKSVSRSTLLLVGLVLLAAFLLFFRLGQADPLTDEVEVAFRAIGYVDYLATPDQTTPYEWFSPAPWWASWSFHDHPPLLFALEHVFIRLLGESLVSVRLLFALFGLCTAWLLYLTNKRWFGTTAGLVTLCATVSSSYFIWLYRIGLQDGAVVMFVVLSLYCLTRSNADKRWWLIWGVVLGMGMLTKYTAIVISPIGLLYAWLLQRQAFKELYIYLGILISLVLFSPVLVYNIQLYQAVGHFDLQFATLLGQDTPEWQNLIGKDIGSLPKRIVNLYPNLASFVSPVFLVISLMSLVYACYRWWYERNQYVLFLLGVGLLLHLEVIAIGPSIRFTTLLLSWMLLLIGYAVGSTVQRMQGHRHWLLVSVGMLVTGYQLFFVWQTNHAIAVVTDSPWVYSTARIESSALGYNQLNVFLTKVFDNNESTLVIYDPRINQVAKLWLYDRRDFYHQLSVMPVDEYVTKKQQELLTEFAHYYYIANTSATQAAGNSGVSVAADSFRTELGNPNSYIFNPTGQAVFEVFGSKDLF